MNEARQRSVDKHTVLIVGSTVFAEGITQTLATNEAVTVVGMTANVMEVQALLETGILDAVIVTGIAQDADAICAPLLASDSDLAIIYVDINTHRMRVINSYYVPARTADLLNAITSRSRSRVW